VIGGGDWGEDRLVPDLMRAAISGTPARVRNPNSIRPWQHVLNPVSGYLVLAQSLTQSAEYAGAWNFGPPESDARSAGWLVEHVARLWPGELAWTHDDGPHPHEARYLKLDSSKARGRLGWRPPVDLDAALEATVAWYAAYPTGVSAAGLGAAAAGGGNGRAGGRDMRALTMAQIESLQYAPSPS
jgi:CDP-glucose 4,6-dehydratase